MIPALMCSAKESDRVPVLGRGGKDAVILNEKNYYEILEITENASQEVVKAAYRALAKKYHPDSFKGSEADREKSMSQINEAYDVLSDEQKRMRYDAELQSKRQREQTAERQNTYRRNEEREDTYREQQDRQKRSRNSDYGSSTEDSCEDASGEEEQQDGGRFRKFVRGVGKEMVKTMQNNSREMENAYLEGLSIDEYTLVRRFKQAKGYKRAGYAKALEELGLLCRDDDGKLVPSYRFKQLF